MPFRLQKLFFPCTFSLYQLVNYLKEVPLYLYLYLYRRLHLYLNPSRVSIYLSGWRLARVRSVFGGVCGARAHLDWRCFCLPSFRRLFHVERPIVWLSHLHMYAGMFACALLLLQILELHTRTHTQNTQTHPRGCSAHVCP